MDVATDGWVGRYAQAGEVKPGDLLTLSFPISEHLYVVHIGKQCFTLARKDSEAVSIAPPGRSCPLYQRQRYRPDRPLQWQITHFVSNERIEW